ncbi:ABC transporter permease [Gaopeijia maritima]|uniref:ABC transporter permease n=1 Tax=Gaopeijia maritima TaxID=3119007 RepID=A0ABU9E522_9BACT
MAPRWLVALLEAVVAADRVDDVVGDLEELHRRRHARWGGLLAWLLTVAEGSTAVLVHGARGAARALAGRGGFSRVELRLALRLLARQPVMTATSVIALGLGIGLVAGGFSVFRQGIFGELPFADADRWVNIESYAADTGSRTPIDPDRLLTFATEVSQFAYLGEARSESVNIALGGVDGGVEAVEAARVSPGIFGHLPWRPVLGRLLVADDARSGAAPVALIRRSLHERRFGGDSEVIGRTLEITGVDHVIVGVLPDEAGFPDQNELWLPHPEVGTATAGQSPAGSRFIAILGEQAEVEAAGARLQQLSDQRVGADPSLVPLRFRVRPLAHILVTPQIYLGIATFLSILVAVLMVIAANVGNLVMARTSQRSGELAVRTALGASRARIVGQLFAESLVMAALAAVLGLAAAGAVLEFYDGLLDELPFWVDLHVAPDTAAAVVLLALLATVVATVAPALKATRSAPGDALRGTRGASARIGRLGGVMIGAEVALSVALLGSALLFAEGFRRYVDPAFDLPDDRVLTARFGLDPSPSTLPTAAIPDDSLPALMTRLAASLEARPEVRAVGFAGDLPRTSPWPEPVEVEGGPTPADAPHTPVATIGPGLLEVLEQTPTSGRDFHPDDLAAGALPVALVTEAFAAARFGSSEVVGRRLRVLPESGDPDPATHPWRTVVGVVPDVMEVAGATGTGGVYLPHRALRSTWMAVRVDRDPAALAPVLRREVYTLDPALRLTQVVRLGEVGAENRAALAALSSGLSAIGAITLLLSLAGIYAIVSLSVTRRTREIGIRVALGEARGAVLSSILRRSGVILALGAVVGAGVGLAFTRMRLFVFAVPEAQWWLFPALVAGTAVAGLLACWIPARRALAIQPVDALRYDGG